MSVGRVGIVDREVCADGGSIFGDAEAYGTNDRLIVGSGDGDRDGGWITDGILRFAVVRGRVLEGDVPFLSLSQVLEIGFGIKSEGAVVIVCDGAFSRLRSNVERVGVGGIGIFDGEFAVDRVSVLGGTDGYRTDEWLVIGSGDGGRDGGWITGGIPRFVVVRGRVLEGDVPFLSLSQVLEIGFGIKSEGAVVIVCDGAFSRLRSNVERVGVGGIGIVDREVCADRGSVLGGTDGYRTDEWVIIGSGDGYRDGGRITGGILRFAVVCGRVLEGDVPCFALSQILEVYAGVEGEGSVVVIGDGAFCGRADDVECVRVGVVDVGHREAAVDGWSVFCGCDVDRSDDWLIIDWVDGDGDGPGVAQRAFRNGEGKAVCAVEVVVWCVGERAVAVDDDGAICGRCLANKGQWIGLGIGGRQLVGDVVVFITADRQVICDRRRIFGFEGTHIDSGTDDSGERCTALIELGDSSHTSHCRRIAGVECETTDRQGDGLNGSAVGGECGVHTVVDEYGRPVDAHNVAVGAVGQATGCGLIANQIETACRGSISLEVTVTAICESVAGHNAVADR